MHAMRIAIALLLGALPLRAGDPEREALPVERPGIGEALALREVTDLDGKRQPLRGPLIVAMTSTSCPLSRKFAPVLARISGSRSVVFVDVDGTDSVDAFRAFAKDHGFRGVLVHDPERVVARAIGATSTTEAFLVDAGGVLRYRGAVSDRYGIGASRERPRHAFLDEALAALDAGRKPEVVSTSAPGCAIVTAPIHESQATWHGSIEGLVQRRCMRCHRDGGNAPFALETYEQVDSRADMVRLTVRKGIMPPWFAAPGHLPLRNDQALTEAERESLLAWLRSDRPRGDPGQAPKPRDWSGGWTIGKPDVVFELPRAVEVKAEGLMDYVHLETPTGFEEDTWVRGWEVLPTARDVVHHVLVFALHPNVERVPGGERGEFLAAFVPGNGSAIYPEGLAKRIPKGARLHFQMHYPPTGRATADRTRVGLLLTDRPRHEIVTAGICNTRLRIPPGAAAHVERAALPVARDIEVLALMPHMHFRGSAFRYEWFSPGNRRTTLLDVPRYDFNWQLAYTLREPFAVPAGSLLRVVARFDNSDANPLNPDPTSAVRWGDQSFDEMLIGYLEYYVPTLPAGEFVPRLRETPASTAMAQLDRDGDGTITLGECPERYRESFAQLDADKDGKVTWPELQPVNR
jgi:hypothetical protein